MSQYEWYQLLFLFFIFCNIGWVIESSIESLYRRRFINRGFLNGPYIPIYGFGGMTILICCMPFQHNGFLVYIVGVLSCTALEFFVGWVMETIFQKQFWDYSMLKFTYKNRISLIPSLFWGLLSLFLVYVLFGPVDKLVSFVSEEFAVIYDAVFIVVMTVDIIISISRHIHYKEYLKKFTPEKAKRLITIKFISLGGAVMRRRRRIVKFIEQLKFEIGGEDEQDDSDTLLEELDKETTT
ncbi:MAG: putative ABC transporter permease [Oscillospiraceae bacterium]|nr:putative ABC transporter permease [Oscillospiraceae bacterium]